MKNQHVVPFANGWAVYPENGKKFKSLAYYKEDAIDYGWEQALKGKVDLVIHDREGNIESVRSARKKRKPRKTQNVRTKRKPGKKQSPSKK